MDMLGSEEERMAILNYYQESDEPQAVENAIGEVCNSVDEEHLQQRCVCACEKERERDFKPMLYSGGGLAIQPAL